MRAPIAWLSGIAAILGAVAGYMWIEQHDNAPSSPAFESKTPLPRAARLGQPVPTFALPDLHGARVAFPDQFRGQPLLINVWASWCIPCVKEIPELNHFAQAQTEHGVQVVGLALDQPEAVQAFIQRIPIDYLLVLDTPGATDASVMLGNEKGLLPYSVLIDERGYLRQQKLGPFEAGEISAWVEKGLQQGVHFAPLD